MERSFLKASAVCVGRWEPFQTVTPRDASLSPVGWFGGWQSFCRLSQNIWEMLESRRRPPLALENAMGLSTACQTLMGTRVI